MVASGHHTNMRRQRHGSSWNDFYSGGRNSPVRSFVTSGNRSGSGISQSMQRNLRPPVFTSMKRIGLLHFGQDGGGVFLGMTLTLDQIGCGLIRACDQTSRSCGRAAKARRRARPQDVWHTLSRPHRPGRQARLTEENGRLPQRCKLDNLAFAPPANNAAIKNRPLSAR
jgi:hypothetical protein